MMTYRNLTRRSFLRIFVCLSVLGLTRPARALAKLGGLRTPEPLAAKLAEFFRHQESASVIGREYLRCVPREADERLLVDLICSSRKERRVELAKADQGKLREWILHQQRKDFENGRIVNIQGWILSKTEVRLCALVALY